MNLVRPCPQMDCTHTHVALTWFPEGKRKWVDRKRHREGQWKELMASGLRLWTDAASAAKDRIARMDRLCSPIPHMKTHRKDTTDINDQLFNASLNSLMLHSRMAN